LHGFLLENYFGIQLIYQTETKQAWGIALSQEDLEVRMLSRDFLAIIGIAGI